MIGRATITLGIGPHSSLLCLMEFVHDHLTMGGATIMLQMGKLMLSAEAYIADLRCWVGLC